MRNDSDSSEKPLIKIEGLCFKRGKKSIFDNFDLTIARGQITAIMGPSGTGKTTLLKLIGGQLKPDSGTIEVDGLVINRLRSKQLYKLRMRMGMLFQSGALFTDINVFENVAFPLREHTKLNESIIQKVVLLKLEAVGLRGAKELMPSELSGGMARRVALARAIALDPEMIMYDEPFTGQDPISMGILVKLIHDLNDAAGISSIIVSHDVSEAFSIADQVCLISSGRVVEQGTPSEMLESEKLWTRQFVKGLPDGPVPFHFDSKGIKQELYEDFR